MIHKIIKLVKALRIVSSTKHQKVKCTFYGKEQDLKVLNTYGISFYPPENSFGVSLSANGNGDSSFVVIDRPDLRFTGLLEGEMKIGNYLTGDYVHFKADGTIEVKATNVKVMGNVEVTGTVTASNFITGAVPDYNAHTHSGVDTGPGNTGGPS